MSEPLWRVLYRAYDQSIIPPDAQKPHPEEECSLIDRYGYAAEIEAFANWLAQQPSHCIRARLQEQARIAREGE